MPGLIFSLALFSFGFQNFLSGFRYFFQECCYQLVSSSFLLAGRVTQPAAKATQLSGRVTQLSGKATQLAGRVTQLSGKVTQPQGKVTQLAGKVTQPQGEATQLSGKATQPQGLTTQRSFVLNRAKSGVFAFNEPRLSSFHNLQNLKLWQSL